MTYVKHIFLGAAFVASVGILCISLQASWLSAAQPDLEARIAKSSTSSVGVTATVQIARDVDSCASRVITTYQPLYLSFDADFTPSGVTAGHYQAATTTVVYESDIYGCGPINARAAATTTITVTEFRF